MRSRSSCLLIALDLLALIVVVALWVGCSTQAAVPTGPFGDGGPPDVSATIDATPACTRARSDAPTPSDATTPDAGSSPVSAAATSSRSGS